MALGSGSVDPAEGGVRCRRRKVACPRSCSFVILTVLLNARYAEPCLFPFGTDREAPHCGLGGGLEIEP